MSIGWIVAGILYILGGVTHLHFTRLITHMEGKVASPVTDAGNFILWPLVSLMNIVLTLLNTEE